MAAYAQNANGLVMPSVDPAADSLAIARIRARMDSIRQHRPTVAVILNDVTSFRKMLRDVNDYAFGLEYGLKTVAGPLRLGLTWSKRSHFGGYFSFGYDF